MEKIRASVRVNGIVQGVGFRPFIHRQIARYGLCGWIRNTSQGVELEVEGDPGGVESFIREIPQKCPKLAVVESVEWERLPAPANYPDFRIIPSEKLPERRTLISPDTCVCDDCLRELFDPRDRRYRYPFINCTNCGPRFTIIKDIPYDRPNTTMAPFPMCPDCAREYGDIDDRRYHAQPNCCEKCGPRLFFLDGTGEPVPGDPIDRAVECLDRQGIVAVKGLGGIHLACRVEDPETAARLRARKHRDAKPFAVMCRDVETAARYCFISPQEAEQLASPRRPIVLLRKRQRGSFSHISENGYIGVMLPYTPVHYLLFHRGPDALVMTSANLSDLPIIYKNEEALSALRGVADGFLLNDREIETRCDDSLLWVVDGRPYPVRRSRGFVPFPMTVRRRGEDILALGAEQKASFTLFKGGHAFQSQHMGDLKNLETFSAWEQQIGHFQRLFDIRPKILACDLHPDYMSTAYARERADREGLRLLQIQHHHAHMAACMADNGLDGDCIGIVWDGTGYGADGTVWGGEFLTGGYTAYSRRGTLFPLPLPGGDRAVREPWRVGAALLDAAGLDPAACYAPGDAARIQTMLSANLNCPVSTSMGRLFDGAASLLGIAHTASYEGQGAVLLEAAATETDAVYPWDMIRENGLYRFDWRPMVRSLWADRDRGVPVGIIAAGFMNTLVEMAAEMCGLLREDTGLDRVALSGGSFQNMYILARLGPALESRGFRVFRHSRVSANDEGISLGQGMIAGEGGETYVPCGSPADR